ncbi:short chain dehydrogenase [gamma proteobacterium HdN1]|nr:short chain dehydrogenase [gamma proteobacterium HdN1]
MPATSNSFSSPSLPTQSLAGLTALVYGGSGGIGFACVRAFASAGAAAIMLVGRNADRGASAVAALSGEFPQVRFAFVAANASQPEGASAGVSGCLREFGAIDILLCTAGGEPMPGIFHTLPIEDLAAQVNGSLMPPILCARAVLPHMMERGSGVILTMASDAGKVATPGEVAIGSAMAGVMMFTRALANEVKRAGIRVNCLSPSIVRSTQLYDNLMADPFASKLFGKAEKMALLGVVEPEDLAILAAYLASPAAAKLSGQVISLNGGISMA